jgi:hypothetical protein
MSKKNMGELTGCIEVLLFAVVCDGDNSVRIATVGVAKDETKFDVSQLRIF